MDDTRVFNATYTLTLDGAVMSHAQHTLTVTGPTSRPELLTFTLDGQPCTFEQAERITRLALSLGRFEKVSESAPSIGNRAACTLHKDLSKLGYTRNGAHYQLATEALERPVSSLASLSAEDAQTVYGYALAQNGMSSRGWAA